MTGDDLEVVRREVDAWTMPPPDDARVIGCVLLTYGDLKRLAALSRLEAQEPTGEQPTPPECPARKAADEVIRRHGQDAWYQYGHKSCGCSVCAVLKPALSTPCSCARAQREVLELQERLTRPQEIADDRDVTDADALRKADNRVLVAERERDALTRKVEKLLDALREAHEELRLIRMKDTNAVYNPTLRPRLSALLVEHEKEQG